MPEEPLAYFITFSCYGNWMHGDDRGSVDRGHNRPGTPVLPPNAVLLNKRHRSLKAPPYCLDRDRRKIVLTAIREIAERKQWALFALHVRTNHVHIIVRANAVIERIMNDCKTAASRWLNNAFPDESNRPHWTRHGSTIYLWSDEQMAEKIDYVLNGQGQPLERYPEVETI
jgi:REP element-mobilizing transposase RayT